jgi:hypothetical protein
VDPAVARPATPPAGPAHVDPIAAARAEVSLCQDELLARIRDEHEAVARTAEASRRLEDAKARLVALENAE